MATIKAMVKKSGRSMLKKKIALVGGARPNFMKIAPLFRELNKYKKNFMPIVVHTGQHYDYEMSKAFFEDLDIGEPDYYLGVGSGSHARQTAEIMKQFEKVCLKEKFDLVVVVGDVNSTVACSIVSRKLHIRVAHVEAGLRSRDLDMPEEINRIVTDSISDFLFVTEKSAVDNLINEGKTRRQIFFVGNTMIDSLKFALDRLKERKTKVRHNLLSGGIKDYGIITLHRPSNVDFKQNLDRIMSILNKVSLGIPLIFPVHPRTKKNIKKFAIKTAGNIHFIKPLRYLEFISLCKSAKFILTDSGGIQEEATFLKIPCLTLRKNTERPVTITKGTNVLVGKYIDKIPGLIKDILKYKHRSSKIPLLWDGKTAGRIVKILRKLYENKYI